MGPGAERGSSCAHPGDTEARARPAGAVVANCCALMAVKQLLTLPLAQPPGETLLSYLLAVAPGTQALPGDAASRRSNQAHVKTAGAAGISARTAFILARAPAAVSSHRGRCGDARPRSPLCSRQRRSGLPTAQLDCCGSATRSPPGDNAHGHLAALAKRVTATQCPPEGHVGDSGARMQCSAVNSSTGCVFWEGARCGAAS